MAVTPEELQTWRAHIGRVKREENVLDLEVLRRFAVATGQSPAVEQSLPLLAHWAFFLEASENGRIGEDGHPLRGDFLPAVSLPRRMFAASSLQFHSSLEPAATTECVTTIADVRHKSGQAGDLIFVDLDREIRQAARLCVHEKRTIIYRNAGRSSLPENNIAGHASGPGCWSPRPVDLFRFSAVTFNAHRIHYDLPYAQQVEGYPNLVVHGPLTAARLLCFAAQGKAIRSFEFKAVSPLYAGQMVRFERPEMDGPFLAVRCDGVTSMTASVQFL